MDLTREVELTQVGSDGVTRTKNRIVSEVSLTVLVNGKELATLQCTPDRLEYLAVGFLLSEGLIKKETERAGLTKRKSAMVKTSGIEECIGWIECEIELARETGYPILVVGG